LNAKPLIKPAPAKHIPCLDFSAGGDCNPGISTCLKYVAVIPAAEHRLMESGNVLRHVQNQMGKRSIGNTEMYAQESCKSIPQKNLHLTTQRCPFFNRQQ